MASNLKQTTDSALAKVDDFNVQDLDFLGQKWPKMTAGHKALIYFLLSGVNILAQPAWAAMALIFIPVACAFGSGTMGFYMLLKAFEEDESTQGAIDVASEDLSEDEGAIGADTKLKAIEAAVEPVYEQNPWVNIPVVKPVVESTDEEGYLDPLDKARATGKSIQTIIAEDGLTDEEVKRWGGAAANALLQGVERPKGSVFEEPPEHAPFDIAKYLAVNPQPMLLTAAPRAGKGAIAAQMLREFKQANPGGVVWVLQPKYHQNEWGYWAAADCIWGDMIEQYQGNVKEVERISKEWTKFIHDWRALPQRPKMLIIDEGIKISCVAPKWFKDFLAPTVRTEASSGETDDRYLVYISQSPLVKDIGMSSGDRSCLGLTCLAKPDKKDHLKVVLNSYSDILPPSDDLYEASDSPKKAVVYYSGLDDWHPLPEYPIYTSKSPHSNNVAGSVKPASSSSGYQKGFTEPSPWDRPSKPVNTHGWDFDDEDDQIPEILHPEISGQIEQLSNSEDARLVCASDFLSCLVELGDSAVVSASDLSKTAWASRWNEKPGGLKDRKAKALAPFIRNAVKFGFLDEESGKYVIHLR